LRWTQIATLSSIILAPQMLTAAHGVDRTTTSALKPNATQIRPPTAALKKTKTALVEFETSPFPYEGVVPEKNEPFLDVLSGDRKGHRMPSGRIWWEDETYRERRVLLHIPKGFDFTRPAVMIVFFHGHRATLARDVRDRQLVPAQVSASGINAVLVAPQFAFNASDSSAGKFWEDGGFQRFIAESTTKLAELHGNPASLESFDKMPVILIAYSGGYLPAAWSLHLGRLDDRLRGVVLLDAVYGELDKFAAWIEGHELAFFVSAYTESTRRQNMALKALLTEHNVPSTTTLLPDKWKRGVTFLATGPELEHEDFVTQAWTEYPIKDLLRRLDEFRR
jgi:hypothetical protein